ncbi:MAG: hypothetical protein Q7R34_11145, partial [Dehalococcoidia bacterium]|nr:hypothetical protein [Dehalococcoidia bacterium]
LNEANKILTSLGFKTILNKAENNLLSTVPHWRNNDMDIPEDLIEEIARLYGYHNLPNVFQTNLKIGHFYGKLAFG